MGMTKKAWLEALDMGHNNRYVQKLLERSIRSNARQELFNAAGVKVKNTPSTDVLVADDEGDMNVPENENANAEKGAPNVPERSA